MNTGKSFPEGVGAQLDFPVARAQQDFPVTTIELFWFCCCSREARLAPGSNIATHPVAKTQQNLPVADPCGTHAKSLQGRNHRRAMGHYRILSCVFPRRATRASHLQKLFLCSGEACLALIPNTTLVRAVAGAPHALDAPGIAAAAARTAIATLAPLFGEGRWRGATC
jgi:hypothetical protein